MPTATATPAAAPSKALTVVERVEQSPAILMLDARASALVELLPDAAAAQRFRRVVIQALAKNPELLDCTPESVVLSVFEAATQGLEPTGAAGGAHLVPYNVNVGTRQSPRYEKHAQLIPDYRGVIRLVTKPPSEVVSLEARVVKEGDEFSYALGTDAFVNHVPSLKHNRSAKATTHVYAVARLKNGERIPDVMDRAEIEGIRTRGRRGEAFSPWATDWDEMAKKTLIKRISKNLPVRPEIRSILVREDELEGESGAAAVASEAPPTGPTKVSRLAQRLGSKPEPAAAAADEVEGEAHEIASAFDDPTPEAPDFLEALRNHADAIDADADGQPAEASFDDIARVKAGAFAGLARELVNAGIAAAFGADAKAHPTAGQVRAIELAAASLGPEAFREQWSAMVAGAAE